MDIIAYIFLIVLLNFALAWLNLVLRRDSYKIISLKIFFSHIVVIFASALFLTSMINEGLSPVSLISAVIFVVFGYLAIYDLHFMEIPLVPTLVLVALSFFKGLVNFLPGADVDPYWVIAFLLPMVIIFLVSRLYKRQVFGGGDYLIIAAMGLTLSAVDIFVALEAAMIIGGLGGVVLSWIRKTSMKKLRMPMVPSLYLGWLIGLVFGEEIWGYIFIP